MGIEIREQASKGITHIAVLMFFVICTLYAIADILRDIEVHLAVIAESQVVNVLK